jgi:amino acid adenylation domain-containing protein
LEDKRARLRELLRQRLGAAGAWFPLSHGQEALWFLWKLAPHSAAYNIVVPIGIRGRIDFAALQRAWQKLTDRHESLRLEFSEEDGRSRQRAAPQYQAHVERVDASRWSDAQLDQAYRESAQKPFDLETSAIPRLTIFSSNAESHRLLLVVHHIISDLWSLIILIEELRGVYAAEKAGLEWKPAPLPVRYEDYVRWQRRLIEGDAGQSLWEYWRKELDGDLPNLDLATDRPRPREQSFRGDSISHVIDADLTADIKQLAGREGVTPYMALLAAYAVLEHRYTGQEQIMVGTPTSGRQRGEVAGVVGDFVNMAPLRLDLSGNPPFSKFLRQVRSKVVGAIQHQDYPFSLMVNHLERRPDLSRSPLFQTSFVLQKFQSFAELSRAILPTADEGTIPFGDLELVPLAFGQQEGQFDVNLEMKIDERGRLIGAWKYAADLFSAATIERMAGHYATLLRKISASPERPVDELGLLTANEALETLASSRGPVVAPPAASSVYELFAMQADKRSDTVAIVCEEEALTYAQLHRRVTGYASELIDRGIGRDTLVALLLPRGLNFVTMMLAASAAGGGFLPLDPRHPPARLVDVVKRSKAVIVVASAELDPELATALASTTRVVKIEDLNWDRAVGPLPQVDGGDLAYVMYTSGSTGEPKGVMVEHRGMVNHVLAKLSDLDMSEESVLAQNGPQSFDIVVWQCLAPFVQGGRVVVLPNDVAENPAELLKEVARRGITVLQLVPSMIRAVLEEASNRDGGPPELPTLKWMVPTGDALPTDLCRRWFELYPGIPLLNSYGSTECSDDQCHYRIKRLESADQAVAIASLGTPIRNMAAYVLDSRLAPVPAGVVGELYIGGIGVGRGYIDDPVRTAAAFIPDPFSGVPGARLYRTRDMARRRVDDKIDFISRVDHMIKLRGFRIEPKEIESVLSRHPLVSDAVVVARETPSGERRLVAYVVAAAPDSKSAGTSAEELLQLLAGNLPQYMVPSAISFVDALPLTANGKLDHRALPAPAWQLALAEEIVAPRTPTEEKLAGIWAAVLGLEQVGITADFFAIGGDSIRSIQIVARAKVAGLHLSPADIFLYRTVMALSAFADQRAEREAAFVETPIQVSSEHLSIALGQVQFDDGSDEVVDSVAEEDVLEENG